MDKNIRYKKQIWLFTSTLAVIFSTFLVGAGFTFSQPKTPNISLVKWSSPINDDEAATKLKGEIYHHTTFINTGDEPTNDLEIIEQIPQQTVFKFDSVNANLDFTGLSVVIEYSSDFDSANPTKADWTYQPVYQKSESDGGYDHRVKAIRLRVVEGMLSNTPPNNKGSISFITKNY